MTTFIRPCWYTLYVIKVPQAAGISLSTLKEPDSIFWGLFDSKPAIKVALTC